MTEVVSGQFSVVRREPSALSRQPSARARRGRLLCREVLARFELGWCTDHDPTCRFRRDGPPGVFDYRAWQAPQPSLRDSVVLDRDVYPAMNRWAILRCPSGAWRRQSRARFRLGRFASPVSRARVGWGRGLPRVALCASPGAIAPPPASRAFGRRSRQPSRRVGQETVRITKTTCTVWHSRSFEPKGTEGSRRHSVSRFQLTRTVSEKGEGRTVEQVTNSQAGAWPVDPPPVASQGTGHPLMGWNPPYIRAPWRPVKPAVPQGAVPTCGTRPTSAGW